MARNKIFIRELICTLQSFVITISKLYIVQLLHGFIVSHVGCHVLADPRCKTDLQGLMV